MLEGELRFVDYRDTFYDEFGNRTNNYYEWDSEFSGSFLFQRRKNNNKTTKIINMKGGICSWNTCYLY